MAKSAPTEKLGMSGGRETKTAIPYSEKLNSRIWQTRRKSQTKFLLPTTSSRPLFLSLSLRVINEERKEKKGDKAQNELESLPLRGHSNNIQ